MKLRNRLVVVTALGFSLSASIHAQSWKDLANKAKQKAKEATATTSSSTAGSSSSPTNSASAGQPPPSSQGTGTTYYVFCADTDNNKLTAYYSNIFAVVDGSRGSGKSDLQVAFGNYVEAKFGGPKNNGVCFPRNYITLEQATKAKGDYQALVSRRLQAKTPSTETGWVPDGFTTASSTAASSTSASTSLPTSSSEQSSDATSATDLSQYETTGPLLYTYCFSGADTPNRNFTYYLSDIFKIHGPNPGMTTSQYRHKLFPHYADPFRKYVDIKLGVPIRYQTNFGCEDGFTTKDLAQQHKTKYHHPPAPGEKYSLTETGWTPTTNTVTSQDLAPNNRRALDLQRALENERTNFGPSCKSNAFLAGNLDCDCYATHMSQARLQQPNNELAGNGVQVKPLLRDLLPTAHLEACTSRQQIESYARKQITSMSSSQSQKDALLACVPSQLASQIFADSTALWQISVYNGMKMRIMMSCPTR